MSNTFADSLLAERAKRRLTQKKVAKRTRPPIYPSTLIDIERGNIGVDDATYRRIMDAIVNDDVEAV
jgi:cytoskeletal protein RodZ